MKSQLAINTRQTKIALRVGFLFFALLFFTPTAGISGEASLPAFGDGKVKVRLYADYFCPPCRDMEPGIEPIISELVRDNVINLTFADTPFYKHSSLYVRYFLYSMNVKNDLETALFVRRSLIEAAKSMLDSEEKLQTFLKEKKIALKPFAPKPVFNTLSRYLKEDKIDATPSCVIEVDGKTNKHVGASDIINALNQLKQKKSKR
jgi:thiol:disulfide interchange protein DsbA